MNRSRSLIFMLVLVLALSACNLPSTSPTTVPPTFSQPGAVTLPPPTNTAPVPLAPTSTVVLPPTPTFTTGPSGPTATSQPGGGLTLDMLKNANYHAPYYNRNIKLTNGVFDEPSYSVKMLDQIVAFGDMTGDGKPEAAVILAESAGGSGVFESLVIMEYKNNAPFQTGEAELGDRVHVNSVDISQGVAHVDLIVPGPGDPLCCPSLPAKQNYWIFGAKLTLMRETTKSGDVERAITIDQPAHWSTNSNPFTVSGSENVLPFENTLSYKIFLTDGTKVNEGTVTVSPSGSGATFSKSFDLSSAGITDWVIIQFYDTSAADGSVIALNSVITRAR